jgi:hypothetical protein
MHLGLHPSSRPNPKSPASSSALFKRLLVECCLILVLSFLKTHYQINLAWVGYGAAHWNTVQGWNALPDLYANMHLGQVWIDG